MDRRGLDLYYKGKLTHVDGRVISGLPDTIGAGDTFFGYFCGANMFAGVEPVQAAQKAITKNNSVFRAQKVQQPA